VGEGIVFKSILASLSLELTTLFPETTVSKDKYSLSSIASHAKIV
jgi:hypothetical protein